MSEVFQRQLTATISKQFPATVEMLQQLVRVPSVTGDEAAVQAVVERLFAERQLKIDRWESTPEAIEPYIWHVGEQELRGRPNVVGRRSGSGGGRSILLNAHTDTVDNGDPARWSLDPNSAEVIDGKLFGRGACDMKGGLVTYVAALAALDELGIELAGDVTIAATVGEEDGGVGSLATILRGYRSDAALITEPTRLAIIAGHAGSLVMRLTITGKSAHGATRDEGVSAVEKFVPILLDLLEWETERNQELDHLLFRHLDNKIPISFGVVQAGTWASTVPEKLVAEARIGFLPGEDPADFSQQVEDRINAVATQDPWLREHPPQIEWFGGQFAPSETPVDAPFVRSIVKAHQQVTGAPPSIEGAPYGADMRLYTELGRMPCVMYGAGDVRVAHQNDEYIDLEELSTSINVVARLLIDWCGVA